MIFCAAMVFHPSQVLDTKGTACSLAGNSLKWWDGRQEMKGDIGKVGKFLGQRQQT